MSDKYDEYTIRDIAKMSGLSIASISRYFNGLKVRPGTAQKIKDTLQSIDYKPNIAAKFMKGQRTGVIGLIVPEISHPFFALITEGVIAEARKNDQLILISSSYGSRENEIIAIDQFSRSILDGLIYIPVSNPQNIPAIESFRNIPLVIAARSNIFPNVPHVYSDNEKGGYLATKYLINQNRRNIAFLGSFWEIPSNVQDIRSMTKTALAGSYSTVSRFIGYLHALEEASIPYNPDKVILCGYSYQNGFDAARTIMAKLSDIDGLVVMTSTVAHGAINAFRAQGFSVPETISIIVFDDDEIMYTSLPHFTSVQLSLKQMGMEAVKSLNRVITNNPCSDTIIDVKLKIGDSTVLKDKPTEALTSTAPQSTTTTKDGGLKMYGL